jgi:hypothetical protein
MQEKLQKYCCEKCNFTSSNKNDHARHLLTRKHQKMDISNIFVHFRTQKNSSASSSYCCPNCLQTYSSRSGLWYHRTTCSAPSTAGRTASENVSLDTGSVIELLQQNRDFKTFIIEQTKHMQQTHHDNIELQRQLINAVNDGKLVNNTIHNNTTNHHNNQKFNLNFFLNTTCKDAINMSDFIQAIEVQMGELENIGRNGYVAGMTDIILSRIKDLDVSKRPVHCTDLKRETMYIKDRDEWNKDTAEKSYLRKAIAMVSKKNYGKTMEWRDHNPECLEVGSPKYDFCFKMMRNVLGDFEDVQLKLDHKIIKNLAKEVVVDR